MSLWTFLPELSARWPIAFVTVVAASTLLALRVSNPYRGALIALAFSLAAAVLFDALSLPQFAFIAFAALAVLATVVPVSPVAMLVVPLLAMATYTRDIQVAGFWTDVLTPEVPMALNFYLPAATGDLIGELFVLAYAGTFAWSFARSAPGAAGYRLAGLASAALTFGILAFSLQPQIWCNAFNHSLKDLGTFGVRTAIQRAGVQPTTKPGTFRVSFASLTWRWFQRSDVRPASTLRFKVDPYVDTLVATPVFQPLRANGLYAVRTPLAPLPRVVRDVRLEVLLSDPGWTGAGAVGPGAAAVVLGRSRYAFTDYRPIGPGQVVFDFPVPARELIDARGVAHFRLALLGRNTLVARQDKSSTVWLRVSAGTGLTSAAERLPYECDLDGDCRVLGVRWALTQVVTLDPEALPNPTGIVAALEYPMDLPPIHGGPWTVALGFVYWLVMLGALAGVAWLGMRAPPVRA